MDTDDGLHERCASEAGYGSVSDTAVPLAAITPVPSRVSAYGRWGKHNAASRISRLLHHEQSEPAQVIERGIPIAGPVSHVMVTKLADHLPLYGPVKIFGSGGSVKPRCGSSRGSIRCVKLC